VYADLLGHLVESPTWRERTLLLRERPELAARLPHLGRAGEQALTVAVAARTGRSADSLYVRTTGAVAHAALRAAVGCWDPAGDSDVVGLFHQAMDLLEQGLRPTD